MLGKDKVKLAMCSYKAIIQDTYSLCLQRSQVEHFPEFPTEGFVHKPLMQRQRKKKKKKTQLAY